MLLTELFPKNLHKRMQDFHEQPSDLDSKQVLGDKLTPRDPKMS